MYFVNQESLYSLSFTTASLYPLATVVFYHFASLCSCFMFSLWW